MIMKGRVASVLVGAVSIAALGGCTPASMAGFDTLTDRPDLERVDVTGVPGWQDGSFRVESTIGRVRRRRDSEAVGWGPDIIGSPADNVRIGAVARFGTVEFSVNRADLGGALEGRCRYIRSEARGRPFGVDAAMPLDPLRLGCAFRIDGHDAGTLDMLAAPPSGMAEPRLGRITMNGVTLFIESAHRLDGLSAVMADAAGYVIFTPDRRPAGAVEMSGAQSRRMLLPRQASTRMAAAAALLTLALFPDPGNVD